LEERESKSLFIYLIYGGLLKRG